MAVVNIQWNNCGAVLAVAGMQRATGQVRPYLCEQIISFDSFCATTIFICTFFVFYFKSLLDQYVHYAKNASNNYY